MKKKKKLKKRSDEREVAEEKTRENVWRKTTHTFTKRAPHAGINPITQP